MKFGLFYEHQLPKPWSGGDEERIFSESLEQVELADKLGYDVVWAAEHHFLPEYSHSSAPEMFLAAASQRTKRIRLGQGIIQATTNHPARIAERIANLDVLSHGRAEFGLGEGHGMMELEPFGVTMEGKRALFEDTVRATLPMLYNDWWEYEGPLVRQPRRSVVPKSVQKPHPPLWVACSQMGTVRDAGAWGMGALGFQFADPRRAELWVGAYYNEFIHRQRRLTDYQVNPNIAVSSYFTCAPTDGLALERNEGSTFFEFSLGQYSRKLSLSTTKSLWQRYEEYLQTPDGARMQSRPKGLVGTPEKLRRTVRAMQDTHIDHLILLVQAGKSRHEHVCESLELFAREVMPEFHDSEVEHQEWKARVLAGDLVLADPVPEELARDAAQVPGPNGTRPNARVANQVS